MMLRRLTDAVLSALLAPPCAVCGRVLDRPLDGAVCEACWAALPLRPARVALDGIAVAQALGPYDGVLRDVVHALKYDGRRSIGSRLSQLMAEHGRHVLAGADLAVPVPLHARRRRERGFNQSEDLARGLGVPVAPLLRRIRATVPQVELAAGERHANVRGAFVVASSRKGQIPIGRTIPRPLLGRTVVLVDDVTTTGATLEACAAALRAAGVAEVRALTAARVASGLR